MLGTALADNLLGLIVIAVLVAYLYTAGSSRSGTSWPPFPRRTRSKEQGEDAHSVRPVGQRMGGARTRAHIRQHASAALVKLGSAML